MSYPAAADSPPPPGEAAEPPQAAVARLVAEASVEIAGRPHRDLEQVAAALGPGATAYVNALPGATYHDAVAVAARLRRAAIEPVPHVAARRLASYTQLRDFLARASGEAGVERALVIAGDAARPVGPFGSSLQLLETGLFQRHGIDRVDVAGYPEGHPRIDAAVLDAALAAKEALGRREGLTLTVVSQFCFEAPVILAWMRGLRAAGCELPVRVGLAGPATAKTLLKYGLRCGIGPSIRALGGHASTLARLLAVSGPEAIVAGLAEAAPPGLQGLHFFPFGGLVRLAAWRRALADGPSEP